MKFHLNLLIVCLITMLASSLCSADVVTLRDGTKIEGVVLEETRSKVVIEIGTSSLKTVRTIPRQRVRSVERKAIVPKVEKPVKEAPKEKAESDESESTGVIPGSSDEVEVESTPIDVKTVEKNEPRRGSRSDRTLFMVIPVHGKIGEEANADGLRKALTQASRRNINHVVFMIDSGGGFVYDAMEVLSILKEHDDQLTYHAVVEEGAISAASVYVAGADDVFVRPDARVGGAVAYSKENSTGATEVDAKFNSIWASELAARAGLKGYPADLFRAMVILEAEIWLDGDKKVHASKPDENAQQLDSEGTILTIRADQLIEIGMAKEFAGDPIDLGEVLGIEGWSHAKGVGEKIITASSRERVKLREQRDKAIEQVHKHGELLDGTDPRSFEDYYWVPKKTGRLRPIPGTRAYADPASVRNWKHRSAETIKHMTNLIEALDDVFSVAEKAEKIGALHLMAPSEFSGRVYNTVVTQRKWFHDHRNSIPTEYLKDR